jgi:hypothetical protein
MSFGSAISSILCVSGFAADGVRVRADLSRVTSSYL